MRVAFLSTPDFGIPTLHALLAAGHEVVGVFTQPDRPRGRGKAMQPCAVKAEAQRLGLPCYAFERIRRREGYEALKALQPDVMVTAAFGQILTRRLLDIPKYGCVNVHGSLLPKYRGPAPIQWAIINGETVTGITTMLTNEGVDTGDILLQRETPIVPGESAEMLFDRLAHIGADLLVETLAALQAGTVTPVPQDHAAATHFPMLEKQDGLLRFDQSAQALCHRLWGVTPWPGGYITLAGGDTLKVLQAMPCDLQGIPGEVLESKDRLIVACAQGAVDLQLVQSPGKRPMPAADYLRGHPIAKGVNLCPQMP